MRKLIFLLAILAAAPSFAQNFIPWGGVSSHTTNYSAVAGDVGNLLSMNCSSCTLTLPSPAPYAQWTIMVQNVNASTLTISRNGLSIDGAASNITLNQNQGVTITSDGTNYFTQRGIGGASGLGDPGAPGIVKRTSLNATSIAAAADVFTLWSGTCNASTFLRGDGACVAAGGVTSFNSRIGVVTPAANDYNFSQVAGGTNLNTNHIGTGGSLDATGTGSITATGLPSATVATLPASPTIGTLYEVTDALTAGSCATGGGSNFVICRWTGASWQAQNTLLPTWNQIGAGSNLNAQTMGAAGSFSPVWATTGTVASNARWSPGGFLLAPALSFALTGGNFFQGHSTSVYWTYITALGESMPSINTNGGNTTFGCSSGSTCKLTITAPTLPTGATGWNVYAVDCSSTPCGGNEVLQTPTCANLAPGVNCVLGSYVTGTAALPTKDTSVVTPTNVQASLCPAGVSPDWYQTDPLTGNTYPSGGMDAASDTVNFQTGTYEICRRIFFNGGAPVGLVGWGRNTFVGIGYVPGTQTNGVANQDRALHIQVQNPTTDTTAHYGIEGVQVQMYLQGAPTITGNPDGEFSAGSFQASENTTTGASAPSLGINSVRAYTSRGNPLNGATAGTGWNRYYGVIANAFDSATTQAGSGTRFEGVKTQWSNNNVADTNAAGVGLEITFPATAQKFAGGNIGIMMLNPTMTVTSVDLALRNDINGLPWYFNGPISLQTIEGNQGAAALNIYASAAVIGSVTGTQASGGQSSSISCSGGASQYGYKLVGIDGNGGAVAGAQVNSSSACTNPLTSGNPATVQLNGTGFTNQQMSQFVRIDVYRVLGPMGTGKVGNLTCTAAATINTRCASFVDTGIVADGTTPPATNSTGSIIAASYARGTLNTVQVAADFTSAANTSLQNITGLAWNLPPVAAKYGFHCALNYSQATAAVADQFGIQVATIAPNSVDASANVSTSTSAATTATLNGLATTTATPIVTFTPSATATIFRAVLDGTIDVPATAPGATATIMVQTSAAADLPTVKRGSYCQLF